MPGTDHWPIATSCTALHVKMNLNLLMTVVSYDNKISEGYLQHGHATHMAKNKDDHNVADSQRPFCVSHGPYVSSNC
jgi:hypothetical protein